MSSPPESKPSFLSQRPKRSHHPLRNPTVLRHHKHSSSEKNEKKTHIYCVLYSNNSIHHYELSKDGVLRHVSKKYAESVGFFCKDKHTKVYSKTELDELVQQKKQHTMIEPPQSHAETKTHPLKKSKGSKKKSSDFSSTANSSNSITVTIGKSSKEKKSSKKKSSKKKSSKSSPILDDFMNRLDQANQALKQCIKTNKELTDEIVEWRTNKHVLTDDEFMWWHAPKSNQS